MAEVLLIGGLGNQLFQYAYALNLQSNGIVVTLTYCDGLTRLDQNGLPQIMSYELGNDIQVLKEEPLPLILFRLRNLILRLNSVSSSKHRPGRALFTRALIGIYRKFSNTLILLENQKTNFYPLGKVDKVLHLGYFQNSEFASTFKIKAQFEKLSLKEESSTVEEYSKRAMKEHPLIIHIRAGDYLSDSRIGVLPIKYFVDAIELALESKNYGSLWLFSDSQEKFEDCFSNWNYMPQYWINPPNLSPAELLEIMKLGEGFIISNSTFSWWAAFLSTDQHVKVYAPAKWFKNLIQPDKICPPEWVRVKSW